jgi:hypothetical protein
LLPRKSAPDVYKQTLKILLAVPGSLPDFHSWLSPLGKVPYSRRNSLFGLHQEPTLTAKSFATFRKADDMIESVIGIIVISGTAALG